MAIMYLSKENFTCPKEQITSFSPYCAVSCINFFEDSMKPRIYSFDNSVDPDQLASKEAS